MSDEKLASKLRAVAALSEDSQDRRSKDAWDNSPDWMRWKQCKQQQKRIAELEAKLKSIMERPTVKDARIAELEAYIEEHDHAHSLLCEEYAKLAKHFSEARAEVERLRENYVDACKQLGTLKLKSHQQIIELRRCIEWYANENPDKAIAAWQADTTEDRAAVKDQDQDD